MGEPAWRSVVGDRLAAGSGSLAALRREAACSRSSAGGQGPGDALRGDGGAATSRCVAGPYPARAGGLWLCSTLVLPGFHAVVVPSGFRTRVQPQRWITIWW
jgi:hypothetical protein